MWMEGTSGAEEVHLVWVDRVARAAGSAWLARRDDGATGVADGRGDLSVGEAGGERVARLDVGGGADEASLGVGGEAVTAVEDLLRADEFEVSVEGVDLVGAGFEESVHAGAEAFGERGRVGVGEVAACGGVEACGEGAEAARHSGADGGGLCAVEPGGEVGDAASHAFEAEVGGGGETAGGGVEAVDAAVETLMDEDGETAMGAVGLAEEGGDLGGETHRGLGGRGAAFVGDEFGDGGVGLVADGGDDWDGAGEDGVGDGTLVEGPEVFLAAPAASDDDGVEGEACVKTADGHEGGGDLGGGAVALNTYVGEDDADSGATAADGVEDVLESGSGAACHDGDAARKGREGTLAFDGEVAQGAEFVAEAAEGEIEGADADGFEGVGEETDAAALGVELDAAGDDDLHALGEADAGFACCGGEHHAVDDGGGVLEIKVPVGAVGEIGDLPHHFDAGGEAGAEGGVDPLGELGDGEAGVGVRCGVVGRRFARGTGGGGGLGGVERESAGHEERVADSGLGR
jgi:hypothetical protein